jgi:hypothetical protein
MGHGLPLSEGEFGDLQRRIEQFMRQVEDLSNKIVDRVNNALPWLGPLADDVQSLLQKFVDLVQKFFSEVGKFFTQWGVPWTLYAHGQTWTNEVGARASALVAQADAGHIVVDDAWDGVAARAYKDTIPQQSKALAGIKAATDELDDALMKIAGGILAFWMGLAAVLAPYVVEMVTAALIALGVVTAPEAAAGAGISTAKMIALLTALVAGTITYLTALWTQMKDLEQRFNNNDPFPADHWPRTTADLSNGRVRPDKTLDWNVRTN